jgi:hypothetical protein
MENSNVKNTSQSDKEEEIKKVKKTFEEIATQEKGPKKENEKDDLYRKK